MAELFGALAWGPKYAKETQAAKGGRLAAGGGRQNILNYEMYYFQTRREVPQ